MKRLVTLILILLSQVSSYSSEIVFREKSVIYSGCEISLGVSSGKVQDLLGEPDRAGVTKGDGDLAKDVLKVDIPATVLFERVFYYHKELILFFRKDVLVAALAINCGDIKLRDCNLASSVDLCLMKKGNEGLDILKRKGSVVYMYRKEGLLFFDDNDDDKADGVLLFRE